MEINIKNYAPNIKNFNNKPYIFDIIRKKYIRFTKEEWVRQCVLEFFINKNGYSKNLVRTEYTLANNKRIDIVFFDRNMEVDVLIECKSPECRLSLYSLEQLQQYNNIVKAKKILLTNGIETFFWERNECGEYVLL